MELFKEVGKRLLIGAAEGAGVVAGLSGAFVVVDKCLEWHDDIQYARKMKSRGNHSNRRTKKKARR